MKIKKSEIIWNITKETALSIIIALVAYILLSPLLIAIIYPDDSSGTSRFCAALLLYHNNLCDFILSHIY